MRFRITKNSEISVRQQLTRQTVLGILSGDLAEGRACRACGPRRAAIAFMRTR
jgi:hypothetical protein